MSTPAPWLYARVSEDIEAIVDEEGFSIADVRGAKPADLNVMVSAPAMLAALKALSRTFVGAYSDDLRDDLSIAIYRADAEAAARAAIARAERAA